MINGAVRLIARGVRVCVFLARRVKLWASAFGGEMKSISAKYSGSQLLQKVRTAKQNIGECFGVMCYVLFIFSLSGHGTGSTVLTAALSGGRRMYLSLSHPRCVCMFKGRI